MMEGGGYAMMEGGGICYDGGRGICYDGELISIKSANYFNVWKVLSISAWPSLQYSGDLTLSVLQG